MNKSIIDIEYSTAIKLFNTISHIVYSECSGKELHSLRRFIKNVDFKTLNFYSKKLNRTIQDKDITGNNYILKLDELNLAAYHIAIGNKEEKTSIISKGFGI